MGAVYKTFIQRAGLWACNSVGSLIFTLVFAALFFVPCFLIVDRYPRPWILRTLRVLGVASLVAVVLLVGAVIASGAWQRDVVLGAMLGVLVVAGAALGFFRAASHGAEVVALHPVGDPLEHWRRVLSEHSRWWMRSRAARELGSVSVRGSAARDALRASYDAESNRHVRRAVFDSLHRLQKS